MRWSVTNFIQTYLHQFFVNLYGLNSTQKLLERPSKQYKICLKKISIGQAIRQSVSNLYGTIH